MRCINIMEIIIVTFIVIFFIIAYVLGKKSKNPEIEKLTSDLNNARKNGSNLLLGLNQLKKKLNDINQDYLNKSNKLVQMENQIADLNAKNEKMRKAILLANGQIKYMENTIKIANSRIGHIPVLANFYNDLVEQSDEYLAQKLENKKRPAKKGAEEVREISKEKKVWIVKAKEMEYRCSLYESLFPSLPELVDDVEHNDDYIYEVVENEEIIREDEDNIKLYLSKEEYEKLPIIEKYQRALENWYFRRKKTKTRLGYDYESYVGYRMERLGYKVEYYGQEQGLQDLGRDLICMKDKKMYIIQCKYWSKKKLIHENVVNQLLGTTLEICINKLQTEYKNYSSAYDLIENKIIIPKIVTNITLSETAKNFANALGVEYEENLALDMYPLIKCNINNGGKIYHLPFDQQYKRTDISKNGEFMALTVEEAEKAGFRRAKRYYFYE